MTVSVVVTVLPVNKPLEDALEIAISCALDEIYHQNPVARILSHSTHIAPYTEDERKYIVTVIWK